MTDASKERARIIKKLRERADSYMSGKTVYDAHIALRKLADELEAEGQ